MTASLTGRSILLVISGGIAAYKVLDLIRLLRKDGAEVRCVLTPHATHFVTPLSVAALAGHKPLIDMFSDDAEIEHIQLSRQADLIVVAPATANLMAKMAHGLADDLASSLLLAANKPIIVAPAMNVMMWQNPATQENVRTLQARGLTFVGPDAGPMACAEQGAGRLVEPAVLFQAIQAALSTAAPLKGLRALVTSGPTFEPLDPVRFIGNRSSGKQGHAIAAALAAAGADVTLVAGPTALPPPQGVRTLAVETAREMQAACEAALPADIAICAAAVADWRPAAEAAQKIKKDGTAPSLTLTENPDILAGLSHHATKRPRLVIGFAAETNKLTENATAKFTRKGCDWLLANLVGDGKGFGTDDNEVILYQKDAEGSILATPWPAQSKQAVAQSLVDAISAFWSSESKTIKDKQ